MVLVDLIGADFYDNYLKLFAILKKNKKKTFLSKNEKRETTFENNFIYLVDSAFLCITRTSAVIISDSVAATRRFVVGCI